MIEELRTYTLTNIVAFNKKFEGEYEWEIDDEGKNYIRVVRNNVCVPITQVFAMCALHESTVREILQQFKMFTPLIIEEDI